MIVSNNERTTLNGSTTLTYPSLHGWDQINLDDAETDVRVQIQSLIRDVPSPWETLELISPLVEIKVMDVLQQEVDDASCPSGYRTACVKCLRALSKARNIVPSSFSSRNVAKEGTKPIGGGGFADIWKGRLHDTQVCLKVLRIFIPEKAREKLLREFCREALVWRQLRHPNILPFLGVSKDLFAPSYCLISPWMINGNIMFYLEAHPDHDRLTSLVQVAEGMKYLHNHDPPIIHADIRGANILVMDDLCCCLADFGLSLFVETQALDSSSTIRKGSTRWLAPEYMDSDLFDQSYMTARDIYAYGCTVVEIFTGKPPFSDIKNEAGVIHEVVTKQNHPPRPPLDIFPNDILWSLVTTCLATASSQRPDATQISSFLTCGINSGLLSPRHKMRNSVEIHSPGMPSDMSDASSAPPSPTLSSSSGPYPTSLALRENQPEVRFKANLLSPDSPIHNRKASVGTLTSSNEGTVVEEHRSEKSGSGSDSHSYTQYDASRSPSRERSESAPPEKEVEVQKEEEEDQPKEKRKKKKKSKKDDEKEEEVTGHRAELEQDANSDPTLFRFKPYELAHMLDPKNLDTLEGIGGTSGLLCGLGSDNIHGLGSGPGHDGRPGAGEGASQRHHDDPEKEVPATTLTEPGGDVHSTHASGIYNKAAFAVSCQRVYGPNVLPERRSKSLLQLMWTALEDKFLILLSIAAVVSLALWFFQDFGVARDESDDPPVDWTISVAIMVIVIEKVADFLKMISSLYYYYYYYMI
ncbi:kinase-like domain-containing protein [Armillaria borealis]|uniref:Kinase-like domain-containing protein n=1 Tax=Armillaria borealis TaxID=47425 RepID=A0AA39J4F7_9AGAR|nr:kinase-like domain-containing protein [Armillaria borealis]